MSTNPAVKRIKKLLALARDKGASENEAASAMSMANRLMLELGLTADDVKEQTEEAVTSPWLPFHHDWHVMCAQAAGALHAVRPIVGRRAGGLAIAFAGRETNVVLAVEMYPYLIEQIEILFKERNNNSSPIFERTFKEGCAGRLVNKALEIVAANRLEIPPQRALQVIDQSLAMADEKFKGVPEATGPQPMYGPGTDLGKSDADRIKIKREIAK